MRHILALAVLLLPTVASAGVYMETSQLDLENPKQTPGTHKMWFDGGKFRSQTGSGDAVQIYRDDTFYVLEMKDKRYTALDKQSLEKMSSTIAAAKKQMDARMANMSPEQRAMVEKMMGQAGLGASAAATPPPRTVKATSRSETAAGRTCKVWEVEVSGKKEQELCVVPAGALPGGPDMLATMRQLGKVFEGFVDSLGAKGNVASDAWRDLQKLDGIPVITRTFNSAGKATDEIRLSAIREEAVAATQFQVPAGFTQRKLDQLPSG